MTWTRPNSYSHFRQPATTANSLYAKHLEKDSCGVGLLAHLKKQPSRKVVVEANDMLVRMSHRGGCGCDPASGDGAGMLVGMPHSFMGRVAREGQFGAPLTQPLTPERYAVGNIFFRKDRDISSSKAQFDALAEELNLASLGWRVVPTVNDALGATSKASEPHIEQVLVVPPESMSTSDFEKELLRLRVVGTARNDASEMYVCSLSNQTITYKGQLTPSQLLPYYKDLQTDDFASHVAMVHSRFSTNTFPSWDRAQPNRVMCHNGEINTLRGNKNWMFARGSKAHNKYFGQATASLLPVCSDGMSDSGNFDSALELLSKASSCDRTLPETMMMMIPEAWQNNPHLSPEKRAMYQYNACLMEPWDGPAMIAFCDGKSVGASLDRNGLRPSRYYVTKDGHVALSSEVGVLEDLAEADVVSKHRLEPGKMFYVDFDQGRIVSDEEIKKQVATSRPFGEWVQKNMVSLQSLPVPSPAAPMRVSKDALRRLTMFGFTTETMDMLLMPMGLNHKEPLGSMGNDAPLAVLSELPKAPAEYFKQLFAQVTNPPIDPIREELVMSLQCPVGPEENILDATPQHASRLIVEHPVLTLDDVHKLKTTTHPKWAATTLDATFAVNSGPRGLADALDRLCEDATTAVAQGKSALLFSDVRAGDGRLPIPSLLVVGAVHQHLLQTQQRTSVALFVEAGDAKEVHDFATLLGFGADAVCPHMAYEALAHMKDEGLLKAYAKRDLSNEELQLNYQTAIGKGLLKVMSKMGISTLQSYKGAQVFEAVGLGPDVINRCFKGTTSRLQGSDLAILYDDVAKLHALAYAQTAHSLRNPGQYHAREGGEVHFNSPASIVALQMAARENSREAYNTYRDATVAAARKVTLRGLLDFSTVPADEMPSLAEMEPVSEIVKRFNTGAMSLGSISQETHEALAEAMNRLGGRSNTGEGGEDPRRYAPENGKPNKKRSAIKQVASGRFGVTMDYLTNADQLQIKMAQGAKPGEGGELPGHKVSDYIAARRHTTPGVGLISPPPHHDIYSIEDLAQLIHDLKNANPVAEISVKLVSEVGVGVVAAGVAKAKAEHITISGHDGGTGASSWTGVKHGGLPWELGLAEAQQTLVLNNLRSRVKLQTDGQLKTGRDVVIAALLGAEEFGFATAPLIALGCIMMRKCHLNTCPVGVATQDPELRKKFAGTPEHVVNFLWLLAEEVQEIVRSLGATSLDELVGRADLLHVDPTALHDKTALLDFGPLLVNAQTLNPDSAVRYNPAHQQDHGLDQILDQKLLAACENAIQDGTPVQVHLPISNVNRTVGTLLSHTITSKYGADGLPSGTIALHLTGHAGQSLGFGLCPGVLLHVHGDANDYVGKALSGGTIVVAPSETALHGQTIAGNAVLYGGTSGAAFFAGKAGERFAVRNSGVDAVVEGVGDHGCEYMTGGHVVVLGPTGRNFGAGMSGGIAYVYDPTAALAPKCNLAMIDLEPLDMLDDDRVHDLLTQHLAHTGSPMARRVLDDWSNAKHAFIKVMPEDYKAVLAAAPVLASTATSTSPQKLQL
ncbi:NADH-dependent glutamate synthase 1 [Saprolegnia diclina VS20]|uniref:glutamate synthase (ferredoxin) n=1 Tax=Saprolegnia diclina (strain VS20) TaxID=1156394 RepID=T0Q3V6_SAPDV|nr:NADH-dependent glutamate synthase 1 [Saprolegnia diclina VS20]EQC29281.1 NADH-dependent glutamate synthase 1 [Saprolegnia diclina VS20]|eukprot:XP_008617255.1 NADH-dependent glutamate synthase 1 [Saprolegnia diclina VS20]